MDSAETGLVWTLGGHLAALSLLAIGGGVVVLAPDVQRYVVDVNHWMSNESFLAAYTLAQVSPGPNLLFVTLVGWYTAGFLGAVVATAAIVAAPTILTLGILRTHRARMPEKLAASLKISVVPLSVGLTLATGFSLARTADSDIGATILTAATVATVYYSKFNPIWLIMAGAVAGMLGWA